MRGLFLIFHGMSPHSGISKKITYQCEALTHCGTPTELCRLEVTVQGARRRISGETVIADFGCGLRGKLTHRICFDDIIRHIHTEGIGFVYIRYDHNATPFTIAFLRQLKRMGVQTILEIPTYPYDHEYKGQGVGMNAKLMVDRCFRRRMARYVDRIATFSDDEQIFGRPTIRISNGINFSQIPLVTRYEESPEELRLLGVANIHPWHGFDRVIAGLAAYYRMPHTHIVRFTLVGDGDPRLMAEYRRMVVENKLDKYVEIAGPLSGTALDQVFERCDMGIASLGRHRSGITKIKTLKNREYAARGIPFVYSETDDDFDQMLYVMKAPADESPLDIEALVHFRNTLQMPPSLIRASIESTLSWDRQMEVVLQQMGIL